MKSMWVTFMCIGIFRKGFHKTANFLYVCNSQNRCVLQTVGHEDGEALNANRSI